MTAERDFSSFLLEDNVYGLAGGLVPEIAERLEVPIADEPNDGDLQNVMKKVGTNKILRNNAQITAMSREEIVDMVERSGAQKAVRRSLWTPEAGLENGPLDAVLVFGGMANWQDRGAALAASLRVPVIAAAGSRVMNQATEITNPHVAAWHKSEGRYPTEAEYVQDEVAGRLRTGGQSVEALAYDTDNGDEIITKVLQDRPELLEGRIALARVANAGVLMASQLRLAARTINPDFDADPAAPQLFVVTDGFPLARTAAQEAAPANYQKGATALRNVVLTAKKLLELQQAGL